jgi:hypothetical protein
MTRPKLKLSELRPELLRTLRDKHLVEDISTKECIVISGKVEEEKKSVHTNQRKSSKPINKPQQVVEENNQLKEVKITNFYDFLRKNDKAWQIELELFIEKLRCIFGGKTTEIAIIIAKKGDTEKNDFINIYLIELKSSISIAELKSIKGKLEDTANRCYFFLMLNSDKHHDFFIDYKVRVKGLVFYNGVDNTSKRSKSEYAEAADLTKILDVFKKKNGLIEINTVLGEQIIPIKFISQPFQNSIIEIDANQVFNF